MGKKVLSALDLAQGDRKDVKHGLLHVKEP